MARHRADSTENGYDMFVDHPRYGRGPRITGLNPKPFEEGANLHWNSTTYEEVKTAYEKEFGHDSFPGYDTDSDRGTRRIPDTAIVADLERQTPATIPVTHYFDVARECRDCKRPFIFFAEEQKHWYEVLGFGLDSDCVKCVECRKKDQGIARHRETYETLFHVRDRDAKQSLDMAEACLALMEAGTFSSRKTETVRMLFNTIPRDSQVRNEPRFAELQSRLLAAQRVDGAVGNSSSP